MSSTLANRKSLFQVDMLNGSIARPIILFSIPVLFSSVFQQLYNTVDTIIVSYTLGEDALAAMGMCSSFYFLLVGFALGCGNGFSVVLSRCFGRGDEARMRRCVGASIIISLLLGVVLSVGGIALLPAFFRLTNAPANLIPQATAYCATILAGSLALIGYNWCTGIFNAMGNSVVPLIFLILSSGLNIVLDYDFIVNRGMDVDGAALATVISQAVSVVGCVIYILLKTRYILPKKEDWAFDSGIYADLITQGLSQGLMSSFVSAGSVVLQAGINSFGSIVIASHTASRKVLDFCFRVFDGIYAAVTTFVAQNRGAITGGSLTRAEGKARIRKGILFGYGAGTVVALLLAAVAIPFSPAIVQAITGSTDRALIETSALYLRVAVPMTVVLNVLFISRNALQALGQRVLPVVASVIEFVGKIIFVWLLVPRLGYFAVILCEPVLWVFMVMELVPALWLNEMLRKE